MTHIDIFFILQIVSLAWFFTHFEPLVATVSYIKKFIPHQLSFIHQALSCWKCQAFWLGLLVTQGDMITSSIASLTAYLLDRWVSSLKIHF